MLKRATFIAYNIFPVFLQNIAVSIVGWIVLKRRYGKIYRDKFRKSLSRSNAESLKCHQREKLSEFLKHSENSHFWLERFTKYNVNVYGDPYVEINKLPILSKIEVKENVSSILVHRKNLRPISTSGSTGSGLQFFGDENSNAEQWAVWWRYWGRYGIRRGMWCAHFGGKTIVPVKDKSPPYYRVNFSSKQVMFSAYHLSSETVSHYISALNKKEIKWLHGYPSVISELARLALNRNIKLSYKVDFVSLGSENVTPTHERIIFDFFGVKPIQHYGLAEGVANLSNIPGETGLTVDEDFSYVEFLPEGGQFKIVGTNFTNYAFPLIRYDTSDLASDVDQNVFPRVVGNIDGRQDDYILLPTGERVGRVASVFNEFDFIDESQLVQKNFKTIVVRLVINARWGTDSELLVCSALRKKLGSDIGIKFEYVEKVQRTASGKIRFVISEI